MILWTQSDSGGSDGRLVRLFRQATAASAARSLRQDQGCAAILEGRLSAARGVVPGGVRDDRERRRLRRHRRWGEAHLSFLRGFAEFHYGIPCADWLRTVMNRINPDLFMACFSSWVAEWRAD